MRITITTLRASKHPSRSLPLVPLRKHRCRSPCSPPPLRSLIHRCPHKSSIHPDFGRCPQFSTTAVEYQTQRSPPSPAVPISSSTSPPPLIPTTSYFSTLSKPAKTSPVQTSRPSKEHSCLAEREDPPIALEAFLNLDARAHEHVVDLRLCEHAFHGVEISPTVDCDVRVGELGLGVGDEDAFAAEKDDA
jgi:hypothetical protein